MPAWKKILFSLIAFTVPFLLVELFLSLYFSTHLEFPMEMARYNATMTEASQFPGRIHEQKASKSKQLMGVEIQTNPQGFRDEDFSLLEPGMQRIAFLGDSLTLGWGVAQQDIFANRLEKKWKKSFPVEVMNLGVANYNTSQQLATLKQIHPHYPPHQVVLFYFINDTEPSKERSQWTWLGYSRFLTLLKSRYQMMNAAGFGLQNSFQSFYSSLYAPSSTGWTEMNQSLAELKAFCQAHEIKLQVVLLPELHQLDPYLFSKEYTLVEGELQKLGIEYLNVTSAFSQVQSPASLWVAPDDAHPNAVGHQIIAQAVDAFITQHLPTQIYTFYRAKKKP